MQIQARVRELERHLAALAAGQVAFVGDLDLDAVTARVGALHLLVQLLERCGVDLARVNARSTDVAAEAQGVNKQVVPVRGDAVVAAVAVHARTVALLRERTAGHGLHIRVVEIGELVQVVHHGLVVGQVVRFWHLALKLQRAVVVEAQVVAQLVHDRVAQLAVFGHALVLGHVKTIIAHEGDANRVVARVHLVTDHADVEDGGTLAQQAVDVVHHAQAGDGVTEVVPLVSLGLSTVAGVVVRDVGVGLASVDVQGNAVLIKLVRQLIQDVAGRAVGPGVRGVALLGVRRVQAAELFVLGFHPVQLQEDIGTVRVCAPFVEGELGAVVKRDALFLPLVGQAVPIAVHGGVLRVKGDRCLCRELVAGVDRAEPAATLELCAIGVDVADLVGRGGRIEAVCHTGETGVCELHQRVVAAVIRADGEAFAVETAGERAVGVDGIGQVQLEVGVLGALIRGGDLDRHLGVGGAHDPLDLHSPRGVCVLSSCHPRSPLILRGDWRVVRRHDAGAVDKNIGVQRVRLGTRN